MSLAEAPAPQQAMVDVESDQVKRALLRAILRVAETAAMAQDAREQHEAGRAALALVQTLAILEPTVDQFGVPLDHQVELEERRAAAAAPTPTRRSIRVNRDGDNVASSYDVTDEPE